MRIGIDIDGVLTDIEQWQIDFSTKYFYTFGHKSIQNHKSYETNEMFGVSKEEGNAFWDCYLKQYASLEPARNFSGEIIQKLKEEGNEIYIITARTYTADDTKEGAEMRNIVRQWLEKYNIFYDKILYTLDDKADIINNNKIDIMIEDSPYNINSLSSIVPVICFHAGYNEDCCGKNIHRCYSWYDIYGKIHELQGKEG